MVLILLTGDAHIPALTPSLPAKFKKLLTPGKIAHALITGDLGAVSIKKYFAGLVGEMTCVGGEWDSHDLPTQQIVTIGNIKIGLIHGHTLIPWGDTEILADKAMMMDVDVLVYGNTLKFESFEQDGRFFINPGTITGAQRNPKTDSGQCSFALMDINGDSVVTYVYQIPDAQSEVKVDKIEFRKNRPAT